MQTLCSNRLSTRPETSAIQYPLIKKAADLRDLLLLYSIDFLELPCFFQLMRQARASELSFSSALAAREARTTGL